MNYEMIFNVFYMDEMWYTQPFVGFVYFCVVFYFLFPGMDVCMVLIEMPCLSLTCFLWFECSSGLLVLEVICGIYEF